MFIVWVMDLTKSGNWGCQGLCEFQRFENCWSEKGGAEFSLEFEGNGFAIYGCIAEGHDYFDVYLDGVNVSKVNETSEVRYEDMPLFTLDHFDFGQHFLIINGSGIFDVTKIIYYTTAPIEPVTPVPTPVPCLTNYFLKVNCTTFIDHYDIDDGGIMNIKNGGIFISHVQFINCSSLQRGGAIFLYNTVTPYPCRVFCTKFDGCKANGGGAICIIQN